MPDIKTAFDAAIAAAYAHHNPGHNPIDQRDIAVRQSYRKLAAKTLLAFFNALPADYKVEVDPGDVMDELKLLRDAVEP